MISTITALRKRIDKMLVAIDRRVRRLPIRFYGEDGSILYETPESEAFPGVAYQTYLGIGPDEDGIDP